MGEHKSSGSAAGREIVCAGGIGWDGPRIDETGDEAKLGNAGGEAFEEYAMDGDPDLDAIATKHGVDREMLGMAFAGARKVWGEIEHWFQGGIEPQRRVEGRTTKGTADLVDIAYEYASPMMTAPGVGDGKRFLHALAVIDGKLGMSDDEHREQLMSYSLALVDELGEFPAIGYVLGVEVHMMPATYLVWKFTEQQLEDFRVQLETQHKRAGQQFAPGDWCKYCPRAHDCEPRDDWIRAQAKALIGASDGEMMTREVLAKAWLPSRALYRALKAYDKANRLDLDLNGPNPLPGGGELRLVAQEEIHIDPSKVPGIEIPPAFAGALRVSKGVYEKTIKRAAPPRKGAAHWRQEMAALEAAGALLTKTKKIPKVIK